MNEDEKLPSELPEWEDRLPEQLPLPQEDMLNGPKLHDLEAHIELLATGAALKKENIIENIVSKKAEELDVKASAKVASATAGLSKAETEKIEAYISKSEAFFKANKQVLGIMGIRQPLGYKTMAMLFPIALTLFLVVAIVIYFPFSIISYIVTFFMDIAGDIAKKITSNGLKIVMAILTVLFTAALLVAIYFVIVTFML